MFYAVSRLAIHTDAQVLHMGALLEFRAALRELVAAGEHHEAALLWGSVLEIQHYPPPPPGRQVLLRASPRSACSGHNALLGGGLPALP